MDMRGFSVDRLVSILRRMRTEGTFTLSGDDVYVIEDVLSLIEDMREKISELTAQTDDLSAELHAVCFRLQEIKNSSHHPKET